MKHHHTLGIGEYTAVVLVFPFLHVYPLFHPVDGNLPQSFTLKLLRWYADGRGFDRHVLQHSFMQTGHEIISTVILSIPLIQEWQLSVTSERVSLSTRKLPGMFCSGTVWIG